MAIWVVFAIVTFLVWLFIYGVTAFLNGGDGVFRCFAEEIMWHIPGGLKRRADYIKDIVDSMPLQIVNGEPRLLGTMSGTKQSWSYEEIRDKNLYSDCAKDMLGSTLGFWFSSVLLPIVIGGMITLGIDSVVYYIT